MQIAGRKEKETDDCIQKDNCRKNEEKKEN